MTSLELSTPHDGSTGPEDCCSTGAAVSPTSCSIFAHSACAIKQTLSGQKLLATAALRECAAKHLELLEHALREQGLRRGLVLLLVRVDEQHRPPVLLLDLLRPHQVLNAALLPPLVLPDFLRAETKRVSFVASPAPGRRAGQGRVAERRRVRTWNPASSVRMLFGL